LARRELHTRRAFFITQEEMAMTTSIGEKRVRVTFNPSASGEVDRLKMSTADLINMCKNLPRPDDANEQAEFFRLQALAMTAYEEAAMWAVKAATAKQ
jgi:hypothetical protein